MTNLLTNKLIDVTLWAINGAEFLMRWEERTKTKKETVLIIAL